MSEIVSWLLANPVRWLVPATFLACVIGIPLMLWWERRRPSAYSRRSGVLGSWRAASATVQAAYEIAVLDASEAAELIVRAEADRVSHLYVAPSESLSD
jgi:hypothetical protein